MNGRSPPRLPRAPPVILEDNNMLIQKCIQEVHLQHMKTPLRRRVFSLFCAVLLFCSLLAPAVYADNAVISTTTMYSYFQTYNTSGTWVDLQTPAHWITSTGEVAYCLQTSKDNPYNAAYTSIDGELVYDDYVLAGLRAILTHGYPADDGGFGDQPARYATANAIRFWLAECHADGVPQYLNLTVNGQWIRGKSGCEDLFDWSLWLLELARSQSIAMSDGSLTFSPSEINLIQDGQYFTGTTYLTKNISGEYSLMDDMPDGKIITGHTGVQSENLTIQIPISYPNSSYTLCAYGFDETPAARLFFWAPASASQQRIVTYVLDDMEKTFVRGFLKVNTPGAVVQPQEGSLQITKTDTNGNPLSGVGFTLYDSSKQAITAKTTNGSGVVIFSGLELGSYYYAETSALPGYVQDSTLYPVSISSAGQTVQKTMTNSMGQGSLKIVKTDENGNPLKGVSFNLLDSSQGVCGNGITDDNGEMFFPVLSLGDYYIQETETLPGFILDTTLIPVSITTGGQTVTKTVVNHGGRGSLRLLKTDENGTPLKGVGFNLYDSNQERLTFGYTDDDGILVFGDLALGTYYYAEGFTIPGYAADDTKYPVQITENGQVVSKTVVNYKSAGTLKILKVDSETNTPLKGAEFTVYDMSFHEVAKGTTDETGMVVFPGLPLGYYNYQETKAPDGYVPTGSAEQILFSANGQVVTRTALNKPARGSIKITKQNDKGEVLSGVVFTLYDENKNELRTGTTDENGVVLFENLPVGNYFYAETSELPGYIPFHSLMSARVGYAGAVEEITFTNHTAYAHIRVIKTDEYGVPLTGVHFILTDADGTKVNEGDTDKDGKVLFASLPLGTYFLKETSAPAGYELDDTPIQIDLTQNGDLITKTITNSHSTGSVSILKTDSVTGAALAGAHFKLTDASRNLVKEGDTGSDGKLTFSGIPIGTYYLSETAAPNGYVLDSTPVTVEITTGGQTVSKTFVNAPAVGSIAVTKTDAASGAALAGVHFKLVDTNGSTVKEGDTDSNGNLSFNDVPLGSYQLIETATVDGYVLDSTPVAVELTQADQTVTKNLTNARARGNVLIRKTASDTGYALPGVQFELLDQSGAVAASGTTGSDGTLLLDNLPLGSYSLKETQTVSGYALKAESIPVSITQNGQTVEVSVTNDPVIGSLKIIKKAAGENTPLSGAGYRLFSQDGTQLSEGYTNDAGELLFEGIPYGSGYYYQEFAAPKGFVLDEGKYPLAVTETESAVVKTHENRRREGTLQVLKQDHQGQPLSNALFLLEYSQDNGKTWTPVTSRASGDAVTLGGCTSFGLTNGQLVSGTDGKAVFTGLRADGSTIYRVTETRAPQGYSLMADPLYVGTLPVAVSDANIADSETVDGTVYTYSLYITATDNPIYRLPETGGNGFRFFPIGLFF